MDTEKIIKGKTNNIELEMEELEYSTIPILKEQISNIDISVECENKLYAPLIKNAKIGNITLKINEEIIAKANILNKNQIEKKSPYDYLLLFFKNYKTYFNKLCF